MNSLVKKDRSLYYKKWRLDHIDEIKLKNKLYHLKHKEENRLYQKQYFLNLNENNSTLVSCKQCGNFF